MEAKDQQIIKEITAACVERGYYQPGNVFHHEPYITVEPDGSNYQYKAMIVKWSIKSTRATILGCRLKDGKWILSTYKQNSIKRYSHGEKMR